jgi:hypothetical protein
MMKFFRVNSSKGLAHPFRHGGGYVGLINTERLKISRRTKHKKRAIPSGITLLISMRV